LVVVVVEVGEVLVAAAVWVVAVAGGLVGKITLLLFLDNLIPLLLGLAVLDHFLDQITFQLMDKQDLIVFL
jgi:hypothetical protein